MPGPILEGRFSDPKPITVPNAPNIVQQLAPLAKIGIQLFEQKKDQENDEFLVGVSNELQTLTEGVAQGQDSATAALRATQIVNKAKNAKPFLRKELNALQSGFAGGPVFSILRNEETKRENSEIAKQAAIQKQYKDFNIDPADPSAPQLLAETLRLNQDLGRLTLVNNIAEQRGEKTVRSTKREAFAFANTVYNGNANRWRSLVGRDAKAFDARSPEDTATILNSIDQSLLSAEAEMAARYGDVLSQQDLNDMTVSMRNEATFIKGMLEGKNTFEVYQKRNELNSKVADFITSPTPQAKALNDFTDKVMNSRNGELVLKLVSPELLELTRGNVGAMLSRFISPTTTMGHTAVTFIEDEEERSRVVTTMFNEFTAHDMDLDDDTAQDMANMLANLSGPMTIDSETFGVDAWTALMDYSASENGNKVISDPRFENFRNSVDGSLDNYADQLLSQGKSRLPEGSVLSIINGTLDIAIDKVTKTPVRARGRSVFAGALANEKAQTRAIEAWRQNYGTRINTLAQAASNIRGGTVEDNLSTLTAIGGLIGDTPLSNELTTEQQLQLEAIVKAGIAEDIAEAKQLLGL